MFSIARGWRTPPPQSSRFDDGLMMCSNEPSPPPPPALLPCPVASVRITLDDARPPPAQQQQSSPGAGLMPADQYRLQLYNYAVQAERLRAQQWLPVCPGYGGAYHPRLALSMSLFNHRILQPEEPKPQHSYIGLIAMAILSSPDAKLVLSDIYQYILDNYPYFRSRGPGWRNSIRHNLSLNDCFVKAGRSANGKGHYWAIHPANVEDFKRGDFRRRKAQRKVRKHMGLAVDDDGAESPSPPPAALSPPPPPPPPPLVWPPAVAAPLPLPLVFPAAFVPTVLPRKRQFDVASLLAPDDDPTEKRVTLAAAYSSDEEDIDVVTSASDRPDGSPGAASPPVAVAPWPFLRPPVAPDRALVRYYEQLAAQHSARRAALQSLGRPSPTHEQRS